jgi:hypothetical protein
MTTDFNLAASAFRLSGTIEATVFARLPDSCHDAEITDIYPGGNIVYVVDPGAAQVFVRFTRSEGFCAQVVRDWEDNRRIPDDSHDVLEVLAEFEGETFSIRTPVYELRPAEDGDSDPGLGDGRFACQFIVISLDAGEHPPIACRIVHEGATIPRPYKQSYGPASRADCEAWRKKHCLSCEGPEGPEPCGGDKQ